MKHYRYVFPQSKVFTAILKELITFSSLGFL